MSTEISFSKKISQPFSGNDTYWKQRAEVEINARKKRKEFENNKIDIYVVRKS